jgi:lipopolysaccharide assembly protein A
VRIVYRAIFLVAAVLLVLFAVSNRETVSVGLWPLPFLADLPLYLLCFLSFLIGGLIGVWAAWIAGRRDRRELRSRRRRIEALRRELAATQSRLEDHSAAAPPLSAPPAIAPIS